MWIVNHYASEPSSSFNTRHFQLATALRNLGWDAVLIAASVEHNSGRQRLLGKLPWKQDIISGIPFIWLRTGGYVGNGIKRMLGMLEFAIRAVRGSWRKSVVRPDVVIGSTVHPLAAMAAQRLAARYRCPFILEIRDFWPQTLIDLGRLSPSSPVAWLLWRVEKMLCSRAQRVVSVLPGGASYLVERGVPAEKVLWIPNGVDLRSFPDPGPRQVDTSGFFTFMYLGAHGQANALEQLIQAMRIVSADPAGTHIRLRMIGAGPRRATLISLAEKLGLLDRSVFFEEPVPKAEVPRIAAEADAFVITWLNRPSLYRYGISPNKVFDYLAAHRPIVMASAASNDPVQDADAGITVPPENPVLLANAMLKVAHLSPAERERLGRNGRQHVQEVYGVDRLAAILAQALDEAVGDQRTHQGRDSHHAISGDAT